MALCQALPLGVVDYQRAWRCQQALVRARQEGRTPDLLLLLEHPPTYTLGRRGDPGNVLASPEELRALGASLCRVDRGGDVTFHGPGQLVGYPILGLTGPFRGVRAYLGALEEVLIGTLADFGIAAGRLPGHTGVWVGEEKIAAIGVRISRWVTSHGFALNVNTDLRYFDQIVPCGLRDKKVTSMERLLGRPVELGAVARSLARHFGERFGLRMEAPREIYDFVGAPDGGEGLRRRAVATGEDGAGGLGACRFSYGAWEETATNCHRMNNGSTDGHQSVNPFCIR